MKLYGFDSADVMRGELVAAEVPKADVDTYGLDAIASELGWEEAFTAFKTAQSELVTRMVIEKCDHELVESVLRIKASYVPVTEVLD